MRSRHDDARAQPLPAGCAFWQGCVDYACSLVAGHAWAEQVQGRRPRFAAAAITAIALGCFSGRLQGLSRGEALYRCWTGDLAAAGGPSPTLVPRSWQDLLTLRDAGRLPEEVERAADLLMRFVDDDREGAAGMMATVIAVVAGSPDGSLLLERCDDGDGHSTAPDRR